MRVFVAGGAGVLGQRLVPLLVARGHQVTATTRSAARLGGLAELGADGVLMDGLDPASVGEAVARARPDVIVHQMTALAGEADMRHFERYIAGTNRLRTEGTDHLLAAAAAAGVQHVVAQGNAAWNGPADGGWDGPENEPLRLPDGPARMVVQPLRHVEETVLAAGGAVLRYGWFYGPGATDDQVQLVRKRQFPIVGGGTGIWSWIHLDDAASATLLAVEQKATGVYNIVDDEPAAVREWLPYLAARAGAKPPLRLPSWLGRLATGELPVRMMTQSRGSNNAKAKLELGWRLRYPSWRQGFAEVVK